MKPRAQPVRRRAHATRHVRGRRLAAPDATTEPAPGPPPEAVFDQVTGPYARSATVAPPGACAYDEDA